MRQMEIVVMAWTSDDAHIVLGCLVSTSIRIFCPCFLFCFAGAAHHVTRRRGLQSTEVHVRYGYSWMPFDPPSIGLDLGHSMVRMQRFVTHGCYPVLYGKNGLPHARLHACA